MCSHFIVWNKIFCFFKKWVFAFLDEGAFQGRESSSSKFWGGLLIKEGAPTDLDFLGGGLGKKGWGQCFRMGRYPGGNYACSILATTSNGSVSPSGVSILGVFI